ncbi:hypothetical protein D3C73_1201530 [compost metagenome]
MVVLVLQHRLDLAQPPGELNTRRGAFVTATVSVAAMVEVHLGQIVPAMPQAAIDCILHPGPVGAGLGTEYPPTGLACSLFGLHPFSLQRRSLGTHPRRQGVEVIRFVQRRYRLYRGIEQADQVAEGIAEKARDTQGHIYPWAIEQAQRQNLEIVDTLATGSPYRAHAHQRHGLGDIVTAGAHGCSAPHRKAKLAQMVAVVLQMAFKDQVR